MHGFTVLCCTVCCAPQDVNKEPGAEETFKKIGEAYEVRGSEAVTFNHFLKTNSAADEP